MTLDLVPMQFGFGVPGGMELAVILLIAILLFGANKIPKLARSTGQAIGEFKRGRQELENELNDIQTDVTEEPSDESPTPATETETTTTDTQTTDTSATDGGETESDETDESK